MAVTTRQRWRVDGLAVLFEDADEFVVEQDVVVGGRGVSSLRFGEICLRALEFDLGGWAVHHLHLVLPASDFTLGGDQVVAKIAA